MNEVADSKCWKEGTMAQVLWRIALKAFREAGMELRVGAQSAGPGNRTVSSGPGGKIFRFEMVNDPRMDQALITGQAHDIHRSDGKAWTGTGNVHESGKEKHCGDEKQRIMNGNGNEAEKFELEWKKISEGEVEENKDDEKQKGPPISIKTNAKNGTNLNTNKAAAATAHPTSEQSSSSNNGRTIQSCLDIGNV